MGMGDDIMLTAEARVVRQSIGLPAKVAYWSEIFDGNPDISRTEGLPLQNRPGHRPYHLGAVRTQYGTKVIFNPAFRVAPGALYGVSPVAHEKVVIEPNYKPDFIGINKDWGWEKYEAVVAKMGADCFVQLGPPGVRRLEGVEYVETPTFRDALNHLAGSRGYLGPEGGLHHAAGALALPAVVIFGGHTPPTVTGYGWSNHHNLASEDAGCGHMFPCGHCRQAMESITVESVLKALAASLRLKERPWIK